ncbi:hypothetical protein [uncultured Marinobacter sp.]|uniref:hypothetical protein n=1 Tax=uncultured Marinobacter sp. TaxID=187379 RepID=UPI002624A5E1|nr:hypothetical protein [uncultured Marinobacter sp.]
MNAVTRPLCVSLGLRVLALWGLLLASQPALPETKILLNNDVSVATLDFTYLNQIFAMQVRKWPNGQAIQVYSLPNSNNLHREFVIERLRIQPHQLDRIWNRMLFTGTGKPPTVVSSEDDMLNMMRSNSGAIGYVSSDYPADGVKLLEEVQP